MTLTPTFPPSDSPSPRTGGEQGYLRIATEEAFATPEIVKIWLDLIDTNSYDDPGFRSLWGFYGKATTERPRFVLRSLQDLGDKRLADMDATGIDRAILSLTSPGVQVLGTDLAKSQAVLANDQLADAIKRHPDRFCGLTAVAPQDPEHAAREIERGKAQLGLSGVIINSHTHGEYLDDPKFWPIFEAAEAMSTPIYLHPNTPPRTMIGPFLEAGLDGAIWGFAVETGTHLLRWITKGVFDRFPDLKVVVGHLGEALPFWMYRLDYMHGATVRSARYDSMRPLDLKPSEYLRRNVWITTSGMAWAPAIMFCREVLGPDRVLYAMDYPYEYVADEVRWQDDLPLTIAEKKQFFQTNAETVFSLPASQPGEGSVAPMPRPKIAVEDRLEIMELFAYYAWGLNTGDADAIMECFTPDGSMEHQPQGIFYGADIRKLWDHLWYAKPGWFIGRQHLANHFVMTPVNDEEMHVKAYYSILQYNMDYRTNFVFGLGNWDNVCTKASGEWLFKSMRICKWMGEDVPWAGEDRAKINAPQGRII